jgi:hypothetical protein
MTRAATDPAVRFWKYVRKTRGCWYWTGATTYGGYGVIQSGPRGGKLLRAHRLSWRIHYGDFDESLALCHHCDNPSCVRPDHLFLGSHSDNMQDMLAKGRAGTERAHGTGHHAAKLTDDSVRAIRAAYAAGGSSLNALAARYGVSKKTILNVVRGRIWTHV